MAPRRGGSGRGRSRSQRASRSSKASRPSNKRSGADRESKRSSTGREGGKRSGERGKPEGSPKRRSGTHRSGARDTARRSGTRRTLDDSDPSPPPETLESSSDAAPAPDVEYLPRPGERPSRDPGIHEVRRVVGELRDACDGCRYRRLCAFAPVKLQIERSREPKARHRHHRVLKEGLKRLARVRGDWELGLITLLAGRERDALLAGCLLAMAWRKRPESLVQLIDYTADRCEVDALKDEAAALPSTDEMKLRPGEGIDPEMLQTRMFRGQVLRAASFFRQSEALTAMQDLLVLNADDEGRLVQYEAVAVLALLTGRRMAPSTWIKSLEKDIAGPFRATFAVRDPGNGGMDLFFPYRRGKRRSYLYLRRDQEGRERLSSIDKIRVDSLLHRIFLVFNSDGMKTHRIFKELCRHLNVRAGSYNANHVLSGFERLDRDDLLLLGFYAPALARAVGHFLGIEDFHRLVKFLYSLKSESGRRGDAMVPAHEKVLQQREDWLDLVDDMGADTIKNIFQVLFRLNASYKKRVYTTPTYLKIGEVAYLLVALSGWNPKGLEIELKQARKPLAFVAYGLQPPGRWSKLRVGKIRRAYERLLDISTDDDALQRAADQGMQYMAALHGYESYRDLEAEAKHEDWEPAEHAPEHLPSDIQAAVSEDFSEFAESHGDEDDEDYDEEAIEDLYVVVDDDQTDEDGRLITQRMQKVDPNEE